jgi:hypothetical protein
MSWHTPHLYGVHIFHFVTRFTPEQSHHQQLLELSFEQRSFINHVQASRNVFLTGLGGTGKLATALESS